MIIAGNEYHLFSLKISRMNKVADKTNKISIAKVVMFVLVLVSIFLLSRTTRIEIIVQQFDEYVKNQGVLAPLSFLVLWIASAVFMFPGAPIAILAGTMFSPILGIIYTSIFSTIGACTAFLIGRHVHSRFVERLIRSSKDFRMFERRKVDHDWKLLALLRLVPIFPYNLVNYWFAMSEIRLYTFAIVSFFCLLPTNVMYVIFGVGIFDMAKKGRFFWTYLLIGLALFIFLLCIRRIISRNKDRT